jgi:hypothetical protein
MTTTRSVAIVTAAAAALLLGASTRPASAQFQIDTKDGKASLKIGFLAQPQLEVVDTADGSAESKNLFLRRLRLVFSGRIDQKWTFFIETDDPNLGKSNPDASVNPAGTKDSGNMYIQDAFVTYNASDLLKVDAGMIIIPVGHNYGQSAAALLPVDFGPYTFTSSAGTGSRVGRDYGAQVRGYPLGQHLEYRLGVFQGVRGPEARNSFRVAGRAVWYPFAADTGFFYGGTWQGSRRVLAIGAGFDKQKEYHTYAADVFVEQPLNGGRQGLTAQVDWMRVDGGTFLPGLPKQDEVLVEGGLHLMGGKVTPLVQYARKRFANPLTPEQYTWQAGVAYWLAGHQRNVKVTAGRQHVDGQPDRTQVLAQLQIYYF